MWYRVLAECVLAAHFAFILWVILGGFAVLKKRVLAALHLPALVWAVYVELADSVCPLTPLENYFREKAGEQGPGEGFIAHYLLPVIYPEGLTDEVQIVLGTALLAFNTLVYAWVLFRAFRPAAPKKEPA